jgi:hypothetical protein
MCEDCKQWFTPGPWRVNRGDEYGQYWIIEVATEQDDWVNEGYHLSDDEGERRAIVSTQRDLGNARLIAAAPDLLTACKRLLQGDDDDDDDTLLNLIADAVAKAEGKEA